MLDFITIPLTFGIVTLGIYKLFELFVCKKERMMILEKTNFNNEIPINNMFKGYNQLPFSFSALKTGCLLMGLGLGLILGLILLVYNMETLKAYSEITGYNNYTIVSLMISAGVLCMGGAGLLLAFIIEYKCGKKKN